MKRNILLISLMVFLCFCHQRENKQVVTLNNSEKSDKESYKNTKALDERENIAYKALYALSTGELNTLSDYITADSGLIVSSFNGGKYKFNKEVIKSFSKSDTTKYHFGVWDGSGLDINLTINDYIKQCIYTEDYLNVKPIDVIKALSAGQRFSSNNFDKILLEHPGCFMKSFHKPSDHWNIIDIVMTCREGKWYIIEIRHRCWTI